MATPQVQVQTRTGQRCQNDDTQIQQCIEQFSTDGFLVLRDHMPLDNIKPWQEFAVENFQDIFAKLHANGHTQFPFHVREKELLRDENKTKEYALGQGVKHGFREIVMRSPGRYEISLLNLTKSEMPPLDDIKATLFPLIPYLLNASSEDVQLCHISLLVSTPGSTEQTWHADGGHVSTSEHLPCHVFNVLIPLTDVPLERGPTEFRPGTQVHTRNLAPMMLAARARKNLRAPMAPELKVGDVLLFDYRVLHRGKANRSNVNRTFLVLTFAKPWYKDICNFPSRSMHDKVEEH